MSKSSWPFMAANTTTGQQVRNTTPRQIDIKKDITKHHYACCCQACMDHAFNCVKKAINQRAK